MNYYLQTPNDALRSKIQKKQIKIFLQKNGERINDGK